MKKVATNLTSNVHYSIIAELEQPTTLLATDELGKKYHVSSKAEVGDVLIFPNETDEPIWMPFDFFKIGRTL